MTISTQEALGHFQDRLERLGSSADLLKNAGEKAQSVIAAAAEAVVAARELSTKASHLVDATAALQALPPAVSAARAEVQTATERVIVTVAKAQGEMQADMHRVIQAVEKARKEVDVKVQTAMERVIVTVAKGQGEMQADMRRVILAVEEARKEADVRAQAIRRTVILAAVGLAIIQAVILLLVHRGS